MRLEVPCKGHSFVIFPLISYHCIPFVLLGFFFLDKTTCKYLDQFDLIKKSPTWLNSLIMERVICNIIEIVLFVILLGYEIFLWFFNILFIIFECFLFYFCQLLLFISDTILRCLLFSWNFISGERQFLKWQSNMVMWQAFEKHIYPDKKVA